MVRSKNMLRWLSTSSAALSMSGISTIRFFQKNNVTDRGKTTQQDTHNAFSYQTGQSNIATTSDQKNHAELQRLRNSIRANSHL